MDETCLKLSQVHPLILFDGSSTFLVVEKQVICNFPVSEVAVALLASYYNFNIEYPKSLKLLGTFLDILLLDKLPKKVPAKVSMILTTLNNV